MADYKLCIPIILKAEGELSDDPADAGGITKWGVCLRFAKDTKDLELFDKDGDGDIDRYDIKKLSIEDATEAFKKYFWNKFDLDNEESNRKALVIFDIAVNHGNGSAASMIQKALYNLGFNIALDGIVGPKTRAALHQANAEKFCEEILNIREKFYYRIVERKPSQKVFLRGWLNRIKNLKKSLSEIPDEA